MNSSLDSQKMNQLLHRMGDDKPVFYWGWYWRNVDWDADHVYLASSPIESPEWYYQTLDSMLGVPWQGRLVGFCQNNKWGYVEFKVEGEEWAELKRRVQTYLLNPTQENSQLVNQYMMEIAPPDEVEQEMEMRDQSFRSESDTEDPKP